MVYVKIKESTAQAKALLAMLKTLPFVEIIEKEDIPNKVTLQAMKDAETKKVTRARNVNDLITKLNK
ncbi:MAG: hypothetical protein FJY07_11490 [Bacteroidetes bacterium]|nr:hypothetical protein [Bacteroidota bacterium]